MSRWAVRDVPGLSVDVCDHGVWVDAGHLPALLHDLRRPPGAAAARPRPGRPDAGGDRTLRRDRLGVGRGTEAEVAQHLARGAVDDAAKLVIETSAPEIVRYLRAVLREEEDACDAFSRIAEAIWRGIGQRRADVRLGAWLFRIVVSDVVTHDGRGADDDLTAI